MDDDLASPDDGPSGPVETIVVPRTADIGGFLVRRALPAAGRRTVGPFVFLDEMGPGRFVPGEGLDVRPHPHIGLATVTYLFDGAIVHRDSLGSLKTIRPGAVNWMSAGRGIAHSERTGASITGSASARPRPSRRPGTPCSPTPPWPPGRMVFRLPRLSRCTMAPSNR